MELFAKIVSDRKPSAVLANSTILHIWQGSEYAFAISSRENTTLVASTLKQYCWWHYITNITERQVKVYSWSNFSMKYMTFGAMLNIPSTRYKIQKKLKNDKRFNNRGYSLFFLMGIFFKHLRFIPSILKWQDCKIFTKLVPSQTPS